MYASTSTHTKTGRKKKKRRVGDEQVKQKDVEGTTHTPSFPPAPIQLYFSIINTYIVTFVNGGVNEGRTDG